MSNGKRLLNAVAMAVLLMSAVSGSALAAKAPDPEPQYYCFGVGGMVVCVPIR